MKIGIQTWGSDGDIRPFLALADGLVRRGHLVTLALSSVQGKTYMEFARPGLEIVPVGGIDAARAGVSGIEMQRLWREHNPLKQLDAILRECFDPVSDDMLAAAHRLAADHEMLVGHFLLHQVPLAAHLAGRRHVSVMLQPGAVPSRLSPPVGFPSLGRWGNRWLWWLAGLMLQRLMGERINRLRRRENLPPVDNVLHDWVTPAHLNLLAFSPLFYPPRPDWAAKHKVCGFFNIPESAETWVMPDSLRDFLAAGAAPVFIGFGSMIDADPSPDSVHAITRLLLDAVRQAGCRAIIQSRWADLTDLDVPATVWPLTSAPHQYLFPHCAAIVHHGGAGTTHSAALAGLPTVVVAHATDQDFWADAAYRLGTASKPLHRRSLSAAQLARAIRAVLATTALHRKARAVADQVRGEDGVACAIRHLEQIGTFLDL